MGWLPRGAGGPILSLHPNRARALVIDCHTHLNRYTPDAPATLAERYASLRAEMETHGIGYALVLSSYAVTPERPSTRDILEVVRGDPRIGVVAGVRYGRDRAEELAELRSLLEEGRIKGLKLYPGYEPFSVQEPGLRELYVLAGRFGVPVMVHTGDTYAPSARVRYAHPLALDEAAVEFPDVTFVLCHLGNPWFVDAMEVVYKNENVVADISGLTLGAFAPRFERFALGKVNEVLAYINNPDKLLFGSDWPISDIESYLGFVRQLEATPEELEGLLWRNAARVFRLKLEGLAGGAHGGDRTA
ncbi:MAG TPA: amidohydrolase family protein [Archangium sp.]|uniref:amidohydrolase family protein n=1 Tax=Archangium sp. TaxID=1872627 RepID=UPI002EDAADBB